MELNRKEAAALLLTELRQRCLPDVTLSLLCDELRRSYTGSVDRDRYLLDASYALQELAAELKIDNGAPGSRCSRLADQAYTVATALMDALSRWEDAVESRRVVLRERVEELWNETTDAVKLFATHCQWERLDDWLISHMKTGGDGRGKSEGATMRILFLAANPSQTSRLDLEEELRGLEQELRGVEFRESITLIARHAVRPDDLIRHVRADRPNVIHFSGHGSKTGVILRDDIGGYQAVEGESLKRFLAGRGVDLVVLNSCYSKDQADTIQGAVKTVVGTTAAVGDEAARRFTTAFYRALGDGLSVREAFRDGGDAVALHKLIDVFYSCGELDLTLVSGTTS